MCVYLNAWLHENLDCGYWFKQSSNIYSTTIKHITRTLFNMSLHNVWKRKITSESSYNIQNSLFKYNKRENYLKKFHVQYMFSPSKVKFVFFFLCFWSSWKNSLNLRFLIFRKRFREENLKCHIQITFLVALVQRHTLSFKFSYFFWLCDTLN